MTDDILQVLDLRKYYHTRGSRVRAVDGVSFCIRRGTTMALVGESGCGKSTTGRAILRLAGPITGGQVLFEGQDVYALPHRALRTLRPRMQMIFQDPFSSLSPRLPVGALIAEAVREHRLVPRAQVQAYVDDMLDRCGLLPRHAACYPHEFSGGQRQRISIARALALQPSFIVCDEPVSALDVSVQAQIVNLLQDLQEERGLTYLFISHDLSVVEHIADTVGVMYLGRLVELAPADRLFAQPQHPYTQALLAAVPLPDPDCRQEYAILTGSIPSPANPPEGCPFHPRCPHCRDICRRLPPPLQYTSPHHQTACHLYPKTTDSGK